MSNISRIKDTFKLAYKSKALENFGAIKERKANQVAISLVSKPKVSAEVARDLVWNSFQDMGNDATKRVALREAAKQEGWKSSKSSLSVFGDFYFGSLNRKKRHIAEHDTVSHFLMQKVDRSENSSEFITKNKAIATAVLMQDGLDIGLRDYKEGSTLPQDKDQIRNNIKQSSDDYQNKIVKRAKWRGITKGSLIVGSISTIIGAGVGSVVPIFGTGGGALIGASLGIPAGWSLGKKIAVSRVKYGLQENFKSNLNDEITQPIFREENLHHEPQEQQFVGMGDQREIIYTPPAVPQINDSQNSEQQVNNTANHIPFDGDIHPTTEIITKRKDTNTGPVNVPKEFIEYDPA